MLKHQNPAALLRNIKKDKWRHFWVGIPMGAFLQLVAYWLFPHAETTAILSALAVVMAISFGFELFSLVTGYGHYDFYDAIASIIGGALGMGIIIWAEYKFGLLPAIIEMITQG